MKKLLIIGSLGLLVLGALGGGGYYVYMQIQPKDDNEIIVVDTTVGKPKPPEFSVTGKVYEVPGMGGVTTTINALFPSSRRDYPMGRFTSADGVVEGKLVVIDEFVSPYFNNRRAVPFAVEQGGSGTFYYLAVLEGDDLRYVTSVPIGDRIKITNISRKDDNVTLSYLVHDKNQPMSDVPTVGTDAIVNIATGVMVQAGRNPQTEASVADKFTGRYFWLRTEYADGKVVKPDSLDYFTLGFSGENVTLETDCNTGGAPLTLGAGSSTVFIVGAVDATKKTCSSQYEVEYFAMFGKVATYSVFPGGKLTLTFADGGSMQFISAAEKEASLNPVATTTATTTTTVAP
jgi:META domain